MSGYYTDITESPDYKEGFQDGYKQGQEEAQQQAVEAARREARVGALEEAIRADEREQCCKDVCWMCGNSWPVMKHPFSDYFMHQKDPTARTYDCLATATRQRAGGSNE